MTVKVRRIYSEQWNPSEEEIDSIFPIDAITEELGRNPGMRVFRDEDVRLMFPAEYNISVQARAHNQSLVELLQEYFPTHSDKPELASLLGIQLPQIKWVDTLGFQENIINLHISKLNPEEVFINSVILVKNEDFDSLSEGILEKVLFNLRLFAKDQGAKYLSGYASNRKTLELFLSNGFREDQRKSMGNDYLWRIASLLGEQLPFYLEL